MNADAFFMIGKTHAVCQDYAQAKPAHILLSDGCSSSPMSDFGARFLVTAAHELLADGHIPSGDPVIHTARQYCRGMNLPTDCLCATLLTSVVREGCFECLVSGDGVLAVRHRHSGSYQIWTYEYPSGAPYYLRYTLDAKSRQAYQDQFGFKHKRSAYILFADGRYEKTDEAVTTTGEQVFTSCWNTKEYDLVAMFTDGVHSFMQTITTATTKSEKPVDFMEVVKELLQFKNHNGIFVQRRMRRAFDPALGNFGKQGWFNTDDLSMGAIVA